MKVCPLNGLSLYKLYRKQRSINGVICNRLHLKRLSRVFNIILRFLRSLKFLGHVCNVTPDSWSSMVPLFSVGNPPPLFMSPYSNFKLQMTCCCPVISSQPSHIPSYPYSSFWRAHILTILDVFLFYIVALFEIPNFDMVDKMTIESSFRRKAYCISHESNMNELLYRLKLYGLKSSFMIIQDCCFVL